MKMKIFLVLTFFSILVFISYIQGNKKEINYTILGDKDLFSNNIISKNFSDLIYDELKELNDFGFYSKDFINKDIRIIDLINDINNNIEIDDISVQNILKRTNLLILNIGNNEINYKLSKIDPNENNDNIIYSYIDEVLIDLEELIKIIKKYNDGNIIFLGYYNDTNNLDNNKYYSYINSKAQLIMKEYNIDFVNLFNILNKNEDYLTKKTPIYITNDGNLAIYNKIYNKIDELYLHKKL
ncbi:MAG: hypothetical protein J6J17_03465 [Bacilli bacterium]|nr:hypothetical protein [Bacilli bacterium]